MKFYIAIACFLFAVAQAQICPFQLRLADDATSRCEMTNDYPCRNPCDNSTEIVAADDCDSVDYCCLNSNGLCVLRVPTNAQATVTFNLEDATVGFLAHLAISNSADEREKTANITIDSTPNPEGRQFGGSQYGSYCPTFPHNCVIPPGAAYDPNSFISPIDIPYCQRIACQPSNPFLDTDFQGCVSQPGCYFDQELAQYRNLVGEAVLPGVPVCQLVIRNRAFRRRANEAAQAIGVWNTLLTNCVLREYRDEIFGEHAGCSLLDYLVYFGHTPKSAGWAGITERECALIGACWRGGSCAYPTNAQGQPTLRSSNDDSQRGRGGQSSNLYGLPVCHPLSASLTGPEFLAGYHTCLASGCAANVDRQTLWDYLIEQGSSLPFPLNLQYMNMVHSGIATPQNYQEVLEGILRPPVGPIGSFGPYVPSPVFPSNIPYNLQLSPTPTPTPEQRFFLANGGNQQYGGNQQFGGNQGPYNPGAGVPFPPQTGGGFPFPPGAGVPVPPQTGGGFPFPPGPFPPQYPPVDPCPYNVPQHNVYGLPQLSGSFKGCCDRPLCYIPKTDLYNPYSGISSYLSQWTRWNSCNRECGGGIQNRTRVCNGDNCGPNALMLQTRACNTHQCPYYGNWRSWSACSLTCGTGSRTRSRVCEGTGGCSGPADESRPCRTGECPTYRYGEWSSCSSTCGRGTRTRVRSCRNGGAYGCRPSTTDESPCEQFCGTSGVTCNPVTCCNEATCLQSDGSPGHCHEDHHRVGSRCYTGNCLFTHAVCPRQPATGGFFQG